MSMAISNKFSASAVDQGASSGLEDLGGAGETLSKLLEEIQKILTQALGSPAIAQLMPAGGNNSGTPVGSSAANRMETADRGSSSGDSRPVASGDAPLVSGAHALDKANGASKVDLSQFGNLQLPTGRAGKVDTVGAGQLGSYNSQYFRHNANGSITMTVPEGGGVHTAHSSFPRTELEENKSWRMSSGTSSLSATTSVDKMPANGDVVIGQIHQKVSSGKPRPPVELHFDKGNIVASVMNLNSLSAGRHNVTIATGIKPGEKFSYGMQMQPNGKLTISAAGQSRSVQMDSSFKDSNMYFKAGNYAQDQSGGSAVTFYGLNISHTR